MDRLVFLNSICSENMDRVVNTLRVENSDNNSSLEDSEEEYESDTSSNREPNTTSSKPVYDNLEITSFLKSNIGLNDSIENETESSDSESDEETDFNQSCVVEGSNKINVNGTGLGFVSDFESSDESDSHGEVQLTSPEPSVNITKNGNGTTSNNKSEPSKPMSSIEDSDSEDSENSSDSSDEETNIKGKTDNQVLKNTFSDNSKYPTVATLADEDTESENETNKECDLSDKPDQLKLQTEKKCDAAKLKVKKMKSAKSRGNRRDGILNVTSTKATKQNAIVIPPPPPPPSRPLTPVNLAEKKTTSNLTGDKKMQNAKSAQVDPMTACFNLIKNGQVKLRSTKANIKDQNAGNVESITENQELYERPQLLSVEGYDSGTSNPAESPRTKPSKIVKNVNTNVAARHVIGMNQNNGTKDGRYDVNNKSMDELDELEIQLMLQLLQRQKEKSIRASNSVAGKNNSEGINLEKTHLFSNVSQQNKNGIQFHSLTPPLRQSQDDRVRDIVKDELVNGTYRLQPTNPPDINITAVMKTALEKIFIANNTTDDEDNCGSYQSEDEMQSWEDGEQNPTTIQPLK